MLSSLIPALRPQVEPDGSYRPSRFSLRVATKPKTDFDGGAYPSQNQGERDTVVVVCTEENRLTMANGKVFATGNHPVETLVPMMHLAAAGFALRVVTPSGNAAQLEHWAMPREDDAVLSFFAEHEGAFARPESLAGFVGDGLDELDRVAAVFLPGGHGALLGLPDDPNVGALLRWAYEHDRLTLAICHGPAALLALGDGDDFPYAGYAIAAFPDRVDRFTPTIGYLPGKLPWWFGEKLEARGMSIVNTLATGTCHRDRQLITGDSPDAANAFGRMAAEALLG